MPSRRQLLATIATGVGLAGCLSDRGPATTDGTAQPSPTSPPGETRTGEGAADPTGTTDGTDATDTGTRTSTGTPDVLAGDCTERTGAWIDPRRDEVNPKPLPEGPPEMTASAVRSFVESYEKAYLYNSILEPDTKSAGTVTGSVSVDETSYGFVVTFRSWYYHNAQGVRSETTGTSTVVHADGAHVWRRYLVTDSRLVRASGSYDRKPAVGDGVVVECWTA
jgi:hypothetical protein